MGRTAEMQAPFFDIEKSPGKRGMRKGAKANFEMALMADGIPAGDVYAMLDAPEGVDRAFAMPNKIKADTIWWEAGAPSRHSCWLTARWP